MYQNRLITSDGARDDVSDFDENKFFLNLKKWVPNSPHFILYSTRKLGVTKSDFILFRQYCIARNGFVIFKIKPIIPLKCEPLIRDFKNFDAKVRVRYEDVGSSSNRILFGDISERSRMKRRIKRLQVVSGLTK